MGALKKAFYTTKIWRLAEHELAEWMVTWEEKCFMHVLTSHSRGLDLLWIQPGSHRRTNIEWNMHIYCDMFSGTNVRVQTDVCLFVKFNTRPLKHNFSSLWVRSWFILVTVICEVSLFLFPSWMNCWHFICCCIEEEKQKTEWFPDNGESLPQRVHAHFYHCNLGSTKQKKTTN